MVFLVPGVFNKCDSDVAECRGELIADACTLNLLIVGVTCLKDAGLECLLNDKWYICLVSSVRCWGW